VHDLLERQLIELYGSRAAVPDSSARLLEVVDSAYRAFDAERANLEHAMAAASAPSSERDAGLRAALDGCLVRERELEETIAVLCSTIDSSDEGILIVDRERHVVLKNRRFDEIWRAAPEAATAQDDQALVAAMSTLVSPARGFLERIEALYADPEAVGSDPLKLRDGRLLERLSTPHRMGAEIVGRIWLFRDVTKRRRLEAQLRQAQKMEALGVLAAGVAHDFNNLLTVISGHAELLMGSLGDSPATQGARSIFDAAARAGSLTRQLLAFGRRQALQPESIDLNDVVRELSEMVARLVHETVEMRLDLAPELDRVFADRGLLEQAILNLVVNARDAMPNGGVLTIATECFDALEESLWGSRGRPTSGQWVVVRVEDSGVGIPQEVLDHIFDPFFTTKPAGKGTGLGLAMVYGFVEQSGGRITVRSQEGHGSIFEILLPKSELETPAPAPTAAATGRRSQTGKETVLVVDDNAPLLEIAKHALELRGYRVLTASRPDEALEIARTGVPIDLLLTDVVLPGRAGTVLAFELRRILPSLRVVFISGYSRGELSRQGAETGETFVLSKPFTLDQIATTVRAALDAPDR
jgi:two-component system cell cycle sensor histidine kinase/response regulator CckA